MAGRGVRRVVIDKIQLLMAVVTVAALVASAMGIASLMTSTIMERAKEIGLMKALGARQWQIMLLFYPKRRPAGWLAVRWDVLPGGGWRKRLASCSSTRRLILHGLWCRAYW